MLFNRIHNDNSSEFKRYDTTEKNMNIARLLREYLLLLTTASVLLPTILVAQQTSSRKAKSDVRADTAMRTDSYVGSRTSAREHGQRLLNQRKHALAIPYYEQWIMAAPGDAAALTELARCYAMAGRTDEAFGALRLALNNAQTDMTAIRRSTDLAVLRDKPAWKEIEGLIGRTSFDGRQEIRHTVQTRYGRWRVLYPRLRKTNEKYRLCLILHGNSQTPENMLRLMDDYQMNNMIFVAPQAPYAKISDIVASARERYTAAGDNLPDSLATAITDLTAEWYVGVLREARATLPVTSDKPIVLGVSQGGYYAFVMATRYPGEVASIVSICGSMFRNGGIMENLPLLRTYGVKTLLLHGRWDDVVPLQTAELTSAALTTANIPHAFHIFDGAHWPTAEANAIVKKWLEEN